MNSRRYLWTILGTGHLLAVVCGAGYCLPDRDLGPVAQVFRWYATMSGAENSFGFFAPEVGTTHRAKFLLRDDQGATWWDTFDQTSNSEARLRLTGIVDAAFMTPKAESEPAWRQRLVRSWAATIFRQHPRAVSLTVVVEAYDVPTRANYRAGSRPTWKVVYQAHVQRHAGAAQERTEP